MLLTKKSYQLLAIKLINDKSCSLVITQLASIHFWLRNQLRHASDYWICAERSEGREAAVKRRAPSVEEGRAQLALSRRAPGTGGSAGWLPADRRGDGSGTARGTRGLIWGRGLTEAGPRSQTRTLWCLSQEPPALGLSASIE